MEKMLLSDVVNLVIKNKQAEYNDIFEREMKPQAERLGVLFESSDDTTV